MHQARSLIFGLALFAFIVQMPAGVLADGRDSGPENNSPGPRSFNVEWHEPIIIDGEQGFTADNGVVDGIGTATDPYIIKGWDLNTSSSTGILIEDTVSYFTILDCYIHGNHSRDGIRLGNVTHGRIESCYISDNSVGIWAYDYSELQGASYCRFTNNSIVSNKYSGLDFSHQLYWHFTNIISSNNISDNGCGISAIVFRKNVITYNLISYNKGFGIEIDVCVGGGGDNLIHHNNLISNNNGSKQGYDQGAWEGAPSIWNDSKEGNYWSDWTRPDVNGDGIVDVPYKFNCSNCDHFPLTKPVEGMAYRTGPPENITIPPDRQPPVIFDIQPVNLSTVEDARPLIFTSFNDSSGIDLQSVSLILDGNNITRNATLTCTSISYMPPEPLPAGDHIVQFGVADRSKRHNYAYVCWTFTASDLTSPCIFDLMPVNLAHIEDDRPVISANFSDESGIYPPSVRLILDSTEVTGHSSYTTDHIKYRPAELLINGVHTVRFALADGSARHNLISVEWNFTVERYPPPVVDRLPPLIIDISPEDASRITDSRPFIVANYSDDSGIDLANITLLLDGQDITRDSTITPSGIVYQPSEALIPEVHSVSLRVGDLAWERNIASAKWNFTILDPEPGTHTFIDKPHVDSNLSMIFIEIGFAVGILLSIVLYNRLKRK